jgi:hypothetical protein
MSLRLAKTLFLVLALLAVSAVLARPICDLDRLPGNVHQHHQEDCCASLKAGTPVVTPDAAAPSVKLPAFLPLTAAWLAEWYAVAWPAVAVPPDRPPLSRPYHARSTRILT